MTVTIKPSSFALVRAAVAAVLVAWPVASAPGPALDYAPLLERLRSSRQNTVDIDVPTRSPLIYRVWGVWTIPHNAQRVSAIALDFAKYPSVFRHVYSCVGITEPRPAVSPLGTWYLEGRALRVRIWAIGNIDTISWNADSTELRVIASQNNDRLLNQRYRKLMPGWLNYITRDLRLAAVVTACGPDTCRVGVIAQAVVNKPMPEWLTRMAVSYILPRTLEDLALEMDRRYPPERKPKAWWHFW